MSYNGSGTFVINSTGQPVVTGTVISSSTFNSLTADLGTGLTTAITKDGQTTTTAKIPFAQGLSAAVASNFAAGTVGAPSIYLSTDTTTGLYRIGANNDGFAISGVKLLDLGSALVGITGALTVSTTLGVTGLISVGAGGINLTSAAGTSFVSGSTASTFTWDGSGSTSGSITINYQIIGKFCTLTLQAVLATTGTSSTTLASNTALPAAFRPVANTLCAIPITNNGAAIAALGIMVISTSGLLFINRDPTGTAFTNSASGGMQQGVSLTYLVA